MSNSFLVCPDDRILVTGAAGFIGSRVVSCLLDRGFRNIACFVRPSSELGALQSLLAGMNSSVRVDLIKGNLLSRADCQAACQDAKIIYHLAAGTGEKSFPDAFMNSVVTTRNLLDASLQFSQLRRFVLVSSFSVYTNRQATGCLDENSPTELQPHLRGDAYCYAKVKQEQIVKEYSRDHGVRYAIIRPGSVYGPGTHEIPGRVGISTFGPFLHLGGPNKVPFTYVDNCADAIVLAGLVEGVDAEVFNVLDDDLPSSRQFLRLYKKNVHSFKSAYIPHAASFALCYLWERYSDWSNGQLPPAFNRRRWYTYWKRTRYSNHKLKTRLGWKQKISTPDAMLRYFKSCARPELHA